ncbi:class II fructose-1,6-bisphosphate aldolase [Lachnospiraceae bacterium LCP25S3_G4]
MALVSSNKVLKSAQEGKYAVGAFNAENMEMVQAIIAAAEEEKSPVIIQTTPSTIAYASVEMFRAMVFEEADKSTVPIVVHLDHGSSYELCKKAMDAAYTSVMIDGSKLTLEENIAITRKVAETATEYKIPVEAELGTVGGKEDAHEVSDKDALYTNPQQAKEFVMRTGIQSLAVAIGTAHGFYKGEPQLDYDRLKEIKEKVSIPLVLHGASGVPDKAVRRAIELGICKVNFATELRVAFTKGVRRALELDQGMFDPKKYNGAGRSAVKELVQNKIKICGSNARIN